MWGCKRSRPRSLRGTASNSAELRAAEATEGECIKPMNPLTVMQQISGCGTCLYKCPFCLYSNQESVESLKQHVIVFHVSFTSLAKNWDGTEGEILGHVLHKWRLEARQLTNTRKTVDVVIAKIWYTTGGSSSYLCPVCNELSTSEDTVKTHFLASHLKFKLIVLSRRFSSNPYDSLRLC